MITTTPEEYDSLPPSIQKKYFSSVERLRIQQQAASQKRKKQHLISQDQSRQSPKQSIETTRSRSFHSCRTNSSLSFPIKARAARTHADVDEHQALRFLSLPEKVKRSHFTPEELVLLTESSERALGISLTDDSERSPRSTIDRNANISWCYYQSSALDSSDDMEKEWMDLEADSVAGIDQEREESDMVNMYVGKRQDSLCSNYSRYAPSTSSSTRSEPRQRSFSRQRSHPLAPISLPPLKLLPAVPPLPSPSVLQSLESARPTLTSSRAETTTGTQYYKDPQARTKIRGYMAPEKFEELLEFGFERDIPSGASGSDYLSSPSSPSAPSVFSESYDSSTMSHSSVDSGIAWPSAGKRRSRSPELRGREMTLRMTLTRPELRAPEEELYAFQRKQVSGVDIETTDPLALGALNICDDPTGAKGAFAVNNSTKGGFRSMLRSLMKHN